MLERPRNRSEIPLWRDVADEEWNDWRWQLRNRITTVDALRRLVPLSVDEDRAAVPAGEQFRLGITPHYATLIDPDDPACPIRLQAIPRGAELAVADFESADPLAEDADSPAPCIIHRYPDRVLFLLTHECALYCRYCTRRRLVGDGEGTSTAMIDAGIEYVRRTPAVRDVLISGGDPLVVSDARLEYVIARLRAIAHVEIIRLGTRMPVVMPQRITTELLAMLRRYHPIWLNTHFNHPFELRHPDARAAMERIADAGIPTGNQTVLLRGVNNSPAAMKQLMHELVKVRCRPYYLYNCDLSEGLAHFRTTVAEGLAIIESLWGHTSGFAVPTYVIDAPGGGGKIPLLPDYLLERHAGRVVLRNYEGRISVYHEGDRGGG
jgi:lysine 2,3-aminomutase